MTTKQSRTSKRSSRQRRPQKFIKNLTNDNRLTSIKNNSGKKQSPKIRTGCMLETNLGGVLEAVPGLDQPRVLSGPYSFTTRNQQVYPEPAPADVDLELAFHEGPDWTQVPDATISPWRSICALNLIFGNGKTATGTGWFVDETTVITAGHNLLYPDHGWVKKVEICPGRNRGGSGLRESVYAYEGDVHPMWEKGVQSGNISLAHDLAYLKIEDPTLGRFLGYFGLRSLTDQELTHGNLIIHSAGYPSTKGVDDSMWVDASRIGSESFDENFIYYRLDTAYGNSGAPIFATFKDGGRYVVACHVHGREARRSNVGVRITDEIFDVIDKWAS